MYEFVAQGCFQNPSLFQQLQRLQLDAVVPGCGGGPRGHARSPDEIAGGFVNKDFKLRQTNLSSRATQELLLDRLEHRQQRFDLSRAHGPWKDHSEVLAAQ